MLLCVHTQLKQVGFGGFLQGFVKLQESELARAGSEPACRFCKAALCLVEQYQGFLKHSLRPQIHLQSGQKLNESNQKSSELENSGIANVEFARPNQRSAG